MPTVAGEADQLWGRTSPPIFLFCEAKISIAQANIDFAKQKYDRAQHEYRRLRSKLFPMGKVKGQKMAMYEREG